MPEILTFDQNLDLLTNPTTGSGGTLTQSPQAPTQAPAAPGATTAQSTANRILDPTRQAVSGARSQLGDVTRNFYSQAGPSRSFASAGGGALRGISAGGVNPQEFDMAKGLFNAQYRGPSGLDEGSTDRLIGDTLALGQQGAGLGRRGSTQRLLGRMSPGLTPGEMRQEARRLNNYEGYRMAREGLQTDINSLIGEVYDAPGRAAEFAVQRGGEEQDIARQAGEALEAERSGFLSPIQTRLEGAQASEKNLQGAWDRFMASGDIKDLEGFADPSELPPGLVDPSLEAQKAWQGIFDNPEYEMLARHNIPNMTKQITRKGRESLAFSPEQEMELRGRLSEEDFGTVQQQARNRYRDLALAGFSPTAENYLSPEVSFTTEGPGKYSNFLPMLGDQELGRDYRGVWEAPAASEFLSLRPGMQATLPSVATEEERGTLTALDQILGRSPQMPGGAVSPYAPGQIKLDRNVFDEVQKGLGTQQKAREEELKGALEARAGELRGARKRYKQRAKARNLAKMGVIPGMGSFIGKTTSAIPVAKNLSIVGGGV